jgi:hypothetical membrane protein
MNGLVLEGLKRSATFFGIVGAKITLDAYVGAYPAVYQLHTSLVFFVKKMLHFMITLRKMLKFEMEIVSSIVRFIHCFSCVLHFLLDKLTVKRI